MTIGFARRATGYKRADLLFSNEDRLRQIIERTGPLQLVYSGKAHSRDTTGKAAIERIFSVAAHLKDVLRVVYLEEYDMALAGLLIAGVDLWLNNPLKPLEASGTSGMKAALNGVPSFSVLDGWWLEGCIEGVTGWAIGNAAEEPGEEAAELDSLYSKARERHHAALLRAPPRLRRCHARSDVSQRELLQRPTHGLAVRAERLRARQRSCRRGVGLAVKAVAFAGPGKMELRDLAEPEAGPGEIVVEVAYCGVCGSDLHEYASHAPSMRAAGIFQPVMGHEFTGIVSAVGQGVNGLPMGDPVVLHPGGPCGNCYFCQSGAANLCAEQIGTGYRKQGAYAERVVVRADQALPLPDASLARPRRPH